MSIQRASLGTARPPRPLSNCDHCGLWFQPEQLQPLWVVGEDKMLCPACWAAEKQEAEAARRAEYEARERQ